MSEIPYLESLPVEILHKIFKCKTLTYIDILKLNSTSTYLRSVTNDNSLWKTKFFQQWKRFCFGDAYHDVENVDWKEEARRRLIVGSEVITCLDVMSVRCRNVSELSYHHFTPVVQLADSYPRGLEFIIDELIAIINGTDLRTNLSRKYYGLKVLRQMRQVQLKGVWEKIRAKPESNQVLEEGAFFLSQWQYPFTDVLFEQIKAEFDRLADGVLEEIRNIDSKHPVLENGARDPAWRTTALKNNCWSPDQCRVIMTAVDTYLFAKEGFRVMRCVYKNLPINKEIMSKECDPLTISIIYEGILRRLGIKCVLVCTSCHFLLSWSERYPSNGEWPEECTYVIDVKNKGLVFRNRGCPFAGGARSLPLQDSVIGTSVKLVQTMGGKIFFTSMQNEAQTFDHVTRLRSILEMIVLVSPDQFNNYMQLMDFYQINGIEIDPDLYDKLLSHVQIVYNWQRLNPDEQNIALSHFIVERRNQSSDDPTRDEVDCVSPKQRSPEVKFAVGLVMTHILYRYRCVIYGWDKECSASPDWMLSMRVYSLKKRHKQPFYNVLVDDGSLRYAAQENLKLVDQEYEIKVPEVGRYFVEWCGRYYKPMDITSAEYPEDQAAREDLLASNPITTVLSEIDE